MRRHARRAVLSAFVASALVATSIPLQEASIAQATALPSLTPPLTQAASKLVGASLLPALNQLVPGLATNPAQLFGLHEVFAKLASLTPASDLETAIAGLSGNGFTFSDVVAVDGTPKDTLTFKLAIDRTIPVELGIVQGDVQLMGGSVDVHVTMPATTISAEFDSSIGGGDEFALTNLPQLPITIAIEPGAQALNESLQFGFAEATATGTFAVNSTVTLALTDPDSSGRLTLAELTTADIADVISVDFGGGTNELAASITLTADVGGTDFTGTVSITDAALFEGAEPVVNISLDGPNPIALLTNLGPDSALAGLNQILSAFGAGMIAGDRPLPFLDGGLFIPAGLGNDFDKVFDAVKPLYDYVQSRSVQLNCGAFPPGTLTPSPTDNVPVLPATDLEANQYVACRAFAGEPPRAGTTVTWTPTGATRLTLDADSFTSVAVQPTTSVIFQMSAPGDFSTTLTFTPDDTGVETTVQQRAQTIQQLLAELESVGALPPNSVTWDPNLQALVLDLSFQSAALARSAGVDAGNGLAADTHLTGLSSTADVAFNVGPVSADLSVGMILTDKASDIGPAPSSPGTSTESRRFFVKVPDSGNVLSVDDVALNGSAGFEGRLGFLEVNGSAALTTSKPAAGPALAVQLDNPTGVQIAGGGSDPNAMLIAELLAKPLSYLDVATNLQINGDVSLTAEALVGNAGAGFDFAWPLDGAPTVSNFSGDFNSLVQFDASETLTVTASSTAATGEAVAAGKPIEVSVTSSATDLTTKPGLVGAVLTRDGQPDCQITAVPSNSTLSCTLTVPEGYVEGTPPLAAGDYEVVGNTLSHLVKILETIASFADVLQQSVDAAQLGDDVEIWGIKPSDLAAQARKLKLLVSELQGAADAEIQCTPVTAGAELRGLPVGGGALTCHATNGNTAASNVRWRIVDTDAGTGAWSDDPAGTTVGSSDPTAMQALTVPDDVDQNGDGFLAMGTEWSAVVEWTDAQGDHRASLPPPTPGSLTRLEQLVQNTLGIPDAALQLGLDTSGATPTLTIELGYGICSSVAPPDLTDECSGMPTGPTPSTNIAFSLGDQSLAALDVQGDPQVTYAALGQFNLGVPLDASEPQILDGTGLTLTARADAPNIGLQAILGPFKAQAGSFVADITGTAQADSATGVLVVTTAIADQIPDGARIERTSDQGTCVVTAHGAVDTNGNIPLTCTGIEWAAGDAFSVLTGSELKGQLGVDVTLSSGPITTTSPSVEITGLDDDCGPLPGGDPIPNPLPTGDPFACARLALALVSGSASTYLGEVGVDVVDTDPAALGFSPAFAVVVPTDLASKLAAAILDPSFLLQALPGILRDIAAQLRNLAEGLPDAVGDPLRSAADGLEGIADVVGEVLDLTGGDLTSIDGIKNAVTNALHTLLDQFLPQTLAPQIDVILTCGDHQCVQGTDGPAAISDISVQLTLGDTIEATAPINLGLEGLPLSVQGGVTAGAEWSLTAGIGLSRTDGPYLNAPTASLTAFVRFADNSQAQCTGILPASNNDPNDWAVDPDGPGGPELGRCLKARLGFLDVEAIDAKADDERTTIEGEATIGLTGGGDNVITFNELTTGDVGIDADIGGTLRINLALRTGIAGTGTDLPSILGTMHFSAAASASGGFEPPEFSFGDLHLDVGTFLTNFLKPVITGINNVISPFKPIIDVINAPIPVVSDLAALVGEPPVTMISLLEAATGADLGMVKSILSIIGFVGTIADIVNSLPPGASLQLPLGELLPGAASFGGFPPRDPGSFSVDTDKASQPTTPDNRGSYIATGSHGGSGFVNDIAGGSDGTLAPPGNDPDDGRPTTFGVRGLNFPFLDDASQIFGLLVGKDAVLIRWDAGIMEASAGLSWDFGPIMVGPVPITISIGGEVGLRGRFAIGYDTVGIRKLIDGGNAASLLDGIFIDDLDAQGNDVNELEFFGRVWAGASVDLVIISAGVKGGIELTFGLNLNDSPDPDGKLRIDEILNKLQNPICLFDVNGRIEAFLDVFVKIDLFFFTKEYDFELVRITLLEWSSACEPPAPDLSEDAGNVLYLNVGSRAPTRNVAVNDHDEKMEVRQLGDGLVRVSGYGVEETADNIDLIVFDAGNGDDEILFLPGGENGNTIPFTIPVAGSGGPGSDIVKIGGEASNDGTPVGGAPDLIRGDDSLSGVTSWAGVSFTPVAAMAAEADETYDDAIEPGAGDDTVAGNGGADTLSGGLGTDSLDGGDGADRVSGGPGNDVIKGGGADDTLSGGPSKLDSASDDDAIVGDGGTDTITGDVGNDVLFGDDSAGTISGSPTLTFTGNRADWATWCVAGGDTDLMTGNNGDDILIGDGGDDQIIGNAGNDKVKGCDGADLISGDEDNDELDGDAGTDTINGGPQNDIIHGGTENDALHGDADQDIVFGEEGADFVYGDDGQDILVGDTGSVNNPSFGVADATELAPDQAKAVAMDGSVVHSHNGTGPRRNSCDPLDPTPVPVGNSDCVIGGNGSDAAFGTGDGDIIEGNAGVDLLVGDTGNDLIRGGTDIDLIFGRADDDELYGESSADLVFGDRPVAEWPPDSPSDTGGTDTLYGGPGTDRLEGDGGVDTIFGGADDDHAEGNGDADTIHGESGQDDLIGGSDKANVADAGDTLITGGIGNDVIAGDNAIITRIAPVYVLGRRVELLDADPAIGGADTIEGDADRDAAFGEVGDDVISGDQGVNGPFLGVGLLDYLEGDNGNDTIAGEEGNDDIVGGNSAQDGIIDADRIGTGLPDTGETRLDGGPGQDWIAGDNARMDRVLRLGPNYPDAATANPIQLFDLATVSVDATTGSFGDDHAFGGDANDLIFGQGGDDALNGEGEADYIEGNAGKDTIAGGDADDDLIGGGSANNGLIDADRVGNGLRDVGETEVTGGQGNDWITGDNGFTKRDLALPDTNPPRAPIELFDVQTAGGPSVSTFASGGDVLQGNEGDDRIFGQGNGAQSASQTDPVDDRNNDFVVFLPNGQPDVASPDFDRLTGTIDEDAATWQGDSIYGGLGDDYIEGNHGNDLIFGNDFHGTDGPQDEDDIAGGGSANPTGETAELSSSKIFDVPCPVGVECRAGLGASLLDGFDTIHGDSANNSTGDDDAIVGDNGWVKRLATTQSGPGPEGLPGLPRDNVSIVDRDVQMTTTRASVGTYANDFISGNGGHDELYGQQGDDYVEGGYGSDAMVGDLGKVTTNLLAAGEVDPNCGAARTISPNEPFIQELVCQPGTLFRLVELYAFDDTATDAVAAGKDVMLGLDGDDWIHGGPGADMINGDGDGGQEFVDPLHTYTTDITDPNPASADVDRIFGGDSNGAGTVSTVTGGDGDDVWGGRGHDHTYGGRGDDMLEVRPNLANPTNFPPAWSAWAEADVESYHGIDFVYGGYDQDAMQANVADNGPALGDRLFDWVGAYNIYYLCPATYGAYVSIRDQSPAILAYFEDQARTDGALTPASSGTSGFNELALVYKKDVKNNANPVYPGTPGHFFCGP